MKRLHLLSLIAAALALAAPAAQADEALLTKGGCMACHTKDKKLVGPAFKDIAAKYKNSDKGQDVAAMLMAKVRAGGKGVFGPIPMPPSGADKISDADLQASVGWILKL